jgi:hypothetical protein
LAFVGCAYGIARFCHHETDGFRLSKITHNLPDSEINCAPATPLAFDLLQQKFRYFARGKQSFAFLSEDGKYVLKIFNNSYQRKLRFLSWLPLCQKKAAYFQNKLERTFNSYQIAFEEMPEETALCYAHLHITSDLPHTLQLIDKLNITHLIDPNAIGFLLQKKVDLVYPALQAFLAEARLEEAEEALISLVRLFFRKYRQGIADNDPLIRTNYGFLGTQAIQIDVGPLSKTAILSQREEGKKTLASLKFWLTQNAPALVEVLDREFEEQLSCGDDLQVSHPPL